MTPTILGCLILDPDTGQPLYSNFFDAELRQNPSLLPERIRSKQIKMIHEMGMHAVYTVLVIKTSPAIRLYLLEFKKRVEKVYPEGFQLGGGNFADYVILQNIVSEIFADAIR